MSDGYSALDKHLAEENELKEAIRWTMVCFEAALKEVQGGEIRAKRTDAELAAATQLTRATVDMLIHKTQVTEIWWTKPDSPSPSPARSASPHSEKR